MKILISVVVPVYNVDPYLDRCIQSILNQTYKNLEIILINDGSTDNSGAICDKYALKDNRIRVFHIKNGGSSVARNFGLEKCSGEYIGFVDSDDWIHSDMFNQLLQFAIDKNIKVVETNSTTVLSNDHNLFKTSQVIGRIEDRDTAVKRIINKTAFAVWRRLYHRSIVNNRFFIEGVLHQDVYYTIDILNKIPHLGYIDAPFYIYNNQNLSSVIRSNYSIKKLDSINAGAYVVENTKEYNEDIQNSAKNYLLNFLTYHYDSLYFNKVLDKNRMYRKSIRKTMKENFDIKNFNFYHYAIINLPPLIYYIFLIANKRRIKIQSKIHYSFRNV